MRVEGKADFFIVNLRSDAIIGPDWRYDHQRRFVKDMEPQLKFLEVPGAPGKNGRSRRLAWWEWHSANCTSPEHVVVCVHGLTRHGRDFDALARALAPHARVLCVDVAGRGQSDWLAQPLDYQIPTYVADLAHFLLHVQQTHLASGAAAALRLDWVGTSMGGLIGMVLAPQAHLGLRRLVLNDVGPELAPVSLRRIADYVGKQPLFATEAEALSALQGICAAFGPHTPEQWLALSRPMLRQTEQGWTLHYDPAIAIPFQALLDLPEPDPNQSVPVSPLWAVYDAIQIPCLLLRGAESDLLTSATAQAMGQRGPKARCVEFVGVGHAPALQQAEQIAVVQDFLVSP